ncbi:MAG: TraR/DksA C4-type zinc finger protein [Acidobacteriota bacterium]
MKKERVKYFEKKLGEKFKEVVKDFDKNKNYGLRDHDLGAHDFLDLASDSYYTEFALLLSDTDREILRQIEEAMQKIKDGRYGVCSECKSEIGEKRLDAVPWARHCIKCQELEEKGLL